MVADVTAGAHRPRSRPSLRRRIACLGVLLLCLSAGVVVAFASARHVSRLTGAPALHVTPRAAACIALSSFGPIVVADPGSPTIQRGTSFLYDGRVDAYDGARRFAQSPVRTLLWLGATRVLVDGGSAACASLAAEDAGGTLIGDAARACDANSFTATTLVTMADGSKRPISRVRLGDLVLATDPQTGDTAARPVTALIVHGGRHVMVDVTLADGATITATDHHPFWDASASTFVYADHLHVGDELVEASGALIRVAGLRILREDVTAYNLTVDGIHTYYAGATPVLVHNSCVNMADLPGKAVRNITTDVRRALSRLADNHGVTPEEFGNQVHAIKASEGLGPAFDLGFGPTGDVWNPISGDLIGGIIHGG